MNPGSPVLEALLVAAGAGAPLSLASVPWLEADLAVWDMVKGFKNVCGRKSKGWERSWGWKLVHVLQNIQWGWCWGQGLNVRDGRVWALRFKWLPSIPQKPKQKNKWIPDYIHEIIVKGLPAVEQLLLYPFHLGSYLLEYSCAGMAGSCWPPLTSALTFIPWQGEYRGARRTIETRRHQSLPVPKPQGHRLAQKALPAAPVSTLLSMESPDNSTFLF